MPGSRWKRQPRSAAPIHRSQSSQPAAGIPPPTPPQQLVQVQFRALDLLGAKPELRAAAVDDPHAWVLVEDAKGGRRKARTKVVVGVQRQEVTAARLADAAVPCRGEAGVLLVDDMVAGPAEDGEDLQGARLARAVVDDDQLGGLGDASLGARHRLDELLAG